MMYERKETWLRIHFYIVTTVVAVFLSASGARAQDERRVDIERMLNAYEGGPAVSTNDAPAAFPVAQPRALGERFPAVDLQAKTVGGLFDEMARMTGWTIIVAETARIEPAIGLAVKDVSVEDLFDIAALRYDLAYEIEDGMAIVMPRQAYADRYGKAFKPERAVRVISLRYQSPSMIEPMVRPLSNEGGLIFMDDKNRQVIIVDTPAAVETIARAVTDRDVEAVTQDFVLQFARAEKVQSLAAKFLTKDVGRLEVNSAKNSISVTDSAAALEKIAAAIREADRKVELTVKVRVVRIRLNEEYANGVDWAAIISQYQQFECAECASEPPGLIFKIGILNEEDFKVLLEALDAVGFVEDLSTWSIPLTAEEQRVAVIDTTSPFSPLLVKDKDVMLDPDGFKIQAEMAASFLPDEMIQFAVYPRLFWMGESDKGLGGIIDPGKKFQVQFEAGSYVVLGGLIKTESVARTLKVPVLGDLPVLGGAFRMDKLRVVNTEYVIFWKLDTSS